MLADRARSLGGSQTSGMRNRARKLRAEGIAVINFAAGELDQDTSPSIKEAAHKAIDSGRTQYTDTMGIKELRERLAQRVSRKTGTPYSADEVGFTAGAKPALFAAAFVSFQDGDEVLIPSPYWVTFPEQVRLAGATPVFIPTIENNFQLDVEAIAARITPRTRGILLNTPHNPTGAVCSSDVLTGIARLAMKHDLVCIFDECYDELVYAPAVHENIVSLLPEMKSRTILIGSFSKTYCMAGWRAGYVAAPKEVIRAISNLQSHTLSNPSNIIQYAALAAMDPVNDAFVASVRGQLGRQRACALKLISEVPGISCVPPEGAFYLFPDVSSLLGKSFQGQRIGSVDALAEMLLEHAHIAVVPGSAFGAENHLRISYAIPLEEIQAGLTQFQNFARQLQ